MLLVAVDLGEVTVGAQGKVRLFNVSGWDQV
jgi:hypothetical protein